MTDRLPEGPFAVSKTWERTSALRWIGGALEQGWWCRETGKLDWRPIPSADNTAHEFVTLWIIIAYIVDEPGLPSARIEAFGCFVSRLKAHEYAAMYGGTWNGYNIVQLQIPKEADDE